MKTTLLTLLLLFCINTFGQINIGLNQTYDANVNQVNAINAFDGVKGDGTPVWSPNTYTGWISVTFDNISTIDSITFEYQASPGNTTTQEIYTTTDGENWVLDQTINLTLIGVPIGSIIHNTITYVFPSPITSTKGLQVKTTQNSSWVSWAEIEVWGNNCTPNSSFITAEGLDSYTAPSGTVYTTSGTYTDTIQNAAGCDSIITITLTLNYTGIGELNNPPKQLIKIVDALGRETPFKPNTPLIYIYDDGSIEKVFSVEY